MRRSKVRYRAEATEDLEDVYRAVLEGSGSTETALGFVRRLRARCRVIGNLPYGGRLRDDLAPGLRTIGFERRAVIGYVVESDCVRITNVFYGGRDFEALYRSGGPDERSTDTS